MNRELMGKPSMYTNKFKKGWYMFLFKSEYGFVDYMMNKNRYEQHVADRSGGWELTEKEKHSRDTWYNMYSKMWNNCWKLVTNWIAVIGIIIASFSISSCEKDELVENNQNYDYCDHPLIVGYWNSDGTVTYYDFRKCN